MRLYRWLALAAALALPSLPGFCASPITTSVITMDHPSGFAERPSISGDGRYVVYRWYFRDTANYPYSQIFLYDRISGTRTLVSQTPSGEWANSHNDTPIISGDGRYVIFSTRASNLGVPANGYSLQRYHRETRVIEPVAAAPGAEFQYVGGMNQNVAPAVSYDGRYIFFTAVPKNGTAAGLYLRDMEPGTLHTLAAPGGGIAYKCCRNGISADGRYVAFAQYLNNGAPNAAATADAFILDRYSGGRELLNVSYGGGRAGASGNWNTADQVSISGDGWAGTFASDSQVVTSPRETHDDYDTDLFLRNRADQTTIKLSKGSTTVRAQHPVLSANGRFVAMMARVTENGQHGLWLYDRVTTLSRRIELPNLSYPSVSADGRFVAYTQAAAPGSPHTHDIGIADMGPQAGLALSHTGIELTEGGIAATYTVALASVPTANVTVTISGGSQATPSPSALSFTPANWHIPQTVSVTAVLDNAVEGKHTGVLLHNLSSTDLDYQNVSAVQVLANITDAVVPTIHVATVGGVWNQATLAVNGTAAPNATVLLSITNASSGMITAVSAVASAQGTWSASIPGLADGSYELLADADGIKSSKVHIKIDSRAPSTTLVLNSVSTKTPDGWYNAAVTAYSTATDPIGGLGVLRTEYTLNNGSWTAFPSSGLALGTEGTHQLCYRSVDNANNTEQTRCTTVAIDLTAPTASASFEPLTNTLIINAGDAGSGIKTVEASQDGGQTWVVQTGPIAFARDGNTTVMFRVTDKAGNVKAGQLSFNVATAPVVTAGAAQAAAETSATTITLGSFTDADATGTWAVDVDWGDGTAHDAFSRTAPGSLGSLAHTYADNGSYTVTIKVADQNGSSDAKTLTVTVSNVAPTATLNLPTQAFAGAPVTASLDNPADVSASDAAAGLRYAFACNGESLDSVSYASASTSQSMACTYSAAGMTTVRARVYDKDGGFSEYSGNINVVIPVTLNLSITGTWTQATLLISGTAAPGAAVQLLLHNAATGADTTVNVTANADGTWSTTVNNLADGPYTVIASASGFSTDPAAVVIDYRAPVSTLSLSSSGGPTAAGWYNATVLANATAEDPATGTGVARIEYALDNGAFAALPAGGATIDSDGQHSLCYRAVDNAGNVEAARCVNVAIDRSAPALAPQFNPANNSFSLTASDALSGLDSVEFSSNGGATWTSYSAPVSFARDGNVTMMVRAMDKAGNSSTGQLSFNVATLPVVTAAPTQAANEAASATFQLGSFSDADAQSSWTVNVDWGDGSAPTAISTTNVGAIPARAHAYADNGSHTVTVSVTDANGSSSSNSFTINVANVAPTGQLNAPATAVAGTNVAVSVLNVADASGVDLAANLRYAFSCDGASLAGATYAGAATASTINCVYTSAGTRTVRARVIDKDGGFSEYTANIAVSVVAQDVTAGTGTAASELVFVKKDHEYSGSVTITNNTALPFPGPIYVVFEGINVNRVRLQNATGTYQGKYYIQLNVGSLDPGASLTFPITFWNPSSADMNYTLKVFAGKLP